MKTLKDAPRKKTTSKYVKGTLYSKNPSAIEYIEEHYPETAKAFQEIQYEQYETFCKKQMDYGPSNISMGTGVGEAVNKKLINEQSKS